MEFLNSILNGLIQGFTALGGLSATGFGQLTDRFFPSPAIEGGAVLFRLVFCLAVLLGCSRTAGTLFKGLGTLFLALFQGRFKWRKASRGEVMACSFLLVCLPLLIAGLVRACLFDYVARNSGKPVFTGVMMLLTAGLFFLGDHSLDQNKTLRDMTPFEGIKLGMFGAFALLPGLSAVATALAMTLNMGFKRCEAVEFAFIAAIPAFLAGSSRWMPPSAPSLPLALGLAGALVGSVAGILLLKRLVNKDRLLIPTLLCGLGGIAVMILH